MPKEQRIGEEHRWKSDWSGLSGTAMVARQVCRPMLSRNVQAHEAMSNEWKRLLAQGVWDVSSVRERDDVASEARTDRKDVRLNDCIGFALK